MNTSTKYRIVAKDSKAPESERYTLKSKDGQTLKVSQAQFDEMLTAGQILRGPYSDEIASPPPKGFKG